MSENSTPVTWVFHGGPPRTYFKILIFFFFLLFYNGYVYYSERDDSPNIDNICGWAFLEKPPHFVCKLDG